MLSSSGKQRRVVGMYRLHRQGEKNQQARNVSSNYQVLIVTANVVPTSLILFTLTREAPHGITSERMAFFIVTA
jgi:hypothetical protein